MGQYGRAAVSATQYFINGTVHSLGEAWDLAIAQNTKSDQARRKCCPKNAYLGLCEAGLVAHIPVGRYGAPKANQNGRYAIHACHMLRANPSLVNQKGILWAQMPAPHAENENGQMDVVLALWKAGLLH